MNVRFDAQALEAELRRRAGRAVSAGAVTLVNKTRELVSAPAPRRRVLSRKGVMYYAARTRATPGAPPRKLSGKFRASWSWQLLDTADGPVGRVGTNAVQARNLIRQGHPHVTEALRLHHAEILAAMRRELAR